MRTGLSVIFAAVTVGYAAAQVQHPKMNLSDCDVVWRSPSKDASGSMPIGNGEVVLNFWVEASTGDLLMYIGRTDSLSEVSRILKLGRIRVHFAGAGIGTDSQFEQKLALRDGTITITGSFGGLSLFVDSDQDVVHLQGKLAKPQSVLVSLEDWRTEERVLPKEEQGSAWSVHDAPFPLIESADRFVDTANDSVEWYHRNETTVVPQVLENQSLTGAAGSFDPLLHRTFGGLISGKGFRRVDARRLKGDELRSVDLSIAACCRQTDTAEVWQELTRKTLDASPTERAKSRTVKWWNSFWDRSWVFVEGDHPSFALPKNDFPLRKGVDSNGGNVFPGSIADWRRADNGAVMTLGATITPTQLTPGRIFDKLTAGSTDGFLFDTYPGDGLRLIVGDLQLNAPHCLQANATHQVAATYDSSNGRAAIFLDGKQVALSPGSDEGAISESYTLQRYVQACQGRGTYPIKFNGGYYTVEPAAMGKPFNPDWRQWGDSQWYQNVRHMYAPMAAQGDFDMLEPFFRLYETARPLAETRDQLYHHATGAYFPETMTVWGTYSSGDYGWDRTGHQPQDVLCPWWQYAWQQGLELVGIMLDRWDYTRDPAFLRQRVLPMATSVLSYFDTRFQKDADGRIRLDPTQSVETYWYGVVNDMPSTAGLISITSRLTALPPTLTTPEQKAFYSHMKAACPTLPTREVDGKVALSPAQQYKDETSNVENAELYAVWPFRVVSLSHPEMLPAGREAYAVRKFHLDVGWGYDGNVAALLGLTDESARILEVKCRNSNPNYRWPATWGPNFDWLPDQNHGGNLLNTTNLMLIQAEPLESGGKILLLPAWPTNWKVDFKLHAPGNTTIRCRAENGKVTDLEVTPPSRKKDVVLGAGWSF